MKSDSQQKKYKYDNPNKKFKIDSEIESKLEELVYYERPRKRFSAEIPYEVYRQLKEKAKEMELPMSKLIVIAFSDVVVKYSGNSKKKKKGKTLVDVFRDEDSKNGVIEEDNHLQFVLPNI